MGKVKTVCGVVALLAGGILGGAVRAGVDPASLEFARLASRRFMLDNELTLCEYAPKTAVAADVQYPVLTNGLTVVGGYWPAAHYRLRVERLPAELAFATKDGAVAEKAVLVNGEAYVRVEKDNLMNYPKKVVVDVAVKSDEDAVKAMAKYCGSEEAATFAVTLLKVGVVGEGEGVEEWCGVCSILMLSINGVFVATKREVVFPII